MQWYYSNDGEQTGPIEETLFLELVEQGIITSESLVWTAGRENWVPYNQDADAPRSENSTAACIQCGGLFPPPEMVPYQEEYVCANCKETFFQRIQEGMEGYVLGGGGTGTTPNAEITADARKALAGRWGIGVGFNLLYQLLISALSQIPFASLVVAGPLLFGSTSFHLSLMRGRDANIGMMFKGFNYFGKALSAYFVMILFIILWTLLFYIPGIIAALNYSMTFYVLVDRPDIEAMDALRRSKKIMYGSRWKLICLQFRFFGWGLLCILTLGIGLLWLIPYMSVSIARFYEDVRGKA